MYNTSIKMNEILLYFAVNAHQIFMQLTQPSQYYNNYSKVRNEHVPTEGNFLNLLFLQFQKQIRAPLGEMSKE